MKRFWKKRWLPLPVLIPLLLYAAAAVWTSTRNVSQLPVLMYHHISEDVATDMVISPARFEAHMAALKEHGWNSVTIRQLIEFGEQGTPLPDHPVLITFDDGYRSNYDIAYPILQKTGMKAVIALIGKSIRANDNTEANRFFLKWDEAAEMADSGLVELASHTYNLHNPQYGGLTAPDGINGIQRLKGESQAAYNKRVDEDLKQSIDLITQNTNQKNVLFFAYPFGARDAWMQPLLQKNGIQISVLTNTGTASIRRRLTDLPRYRITMDTKLSDILPANPNASHDITVRAHMPTMIKNEKIRQEVARHLPAQERTIKIPKSYT